MADREIVYKVDRWYKRIHLVLEEPEATAEGGSCDLPFLALGSSLLAGTPSEWRMGVEPVDSEAGPQCWVEGVVVNYFGQERGCLGREYRGKGTMGRNSRCGGNGDDVPCGAVERLRPKRALLNIFSFVWRWQRCQK